MSDIKGISCNAEVPIMYLFYTNEYRRGRKHSRELLAKSIAMLTEQLANAESTADSSSPEDSSEICLSKELYCM